MLITGTCCMAFQNASQLDFRQATITTVERDQINVTNLFGGELGLGRLKAAEMDASNRTECLAGTRVETIEFIDDWASDLISEHRVLWLFGLAGSGKSTLATTVANRFREMGRLGAFLFFDRDVAERSHPASVIRTTAYQLGCNYPAIGRDISESINNFPSIGQSPFRLQFSKLLVEPLISHVFRKPLMLVLDGLDECGNIDDRQNLLSALVQESAHLPATLRLIITSRAEYNIQMAIRSQPHILTWELDITSQTNAADIQTYFRTRMNMIRADRPQLSFPLDWPSDEIIQSLTQRASGLFVWAATALEFIHKAHYPVRRLRALLQDGVASGPEAALDKLYRTALEEAGKWHDDDFVEDFHAIMGVVLVARNPLSIQTIDLLLSITSANTISLLGCLLTPSPTVRVLHPSLADFLFIQERCQRDAWFIDAPWHNVRLAFLCIDRLDVTLKRNICDLTFSSDKIEAFLNEDISYACVFWIDHVCAVEQTISNLRDRVDKFLAQHLLHWFEAMSILKISRETIRLLERLHKWIHTRFPNQPINLIEDACRFVQAFIDPIADHPLSVYFSALPFTPIHSALYRIYSQSESVPIVVGGFETSWSPLLIVFQGQTTALSSVAFSWDRTRVACGSLADDDEDATIRVWDLSSGAELLSPLHGHGRCVSAIAFSYDDARIASGGNNGTVCVWDASSGDAAFEPLVGHKEHDVELVTFSPGGRYIAGSSNSRTNQNSELRIWDGSSGAKLLNIQTDIIHSLAFAPDGTRLALAFGYGTIQVYDIPSGHLIFGRMQPDVGSDEHLFHVMWSSNGKRILTLTKDQNSNLWDAEAGTEITTIGHKYDQHCSVITSLAISHDGTHIAYGYQNKNIIRIKLPDEGFLPPLQGHKATILSLAFSPDSKRLCSASKDRTIRVWDTTSIVPDDGRHNTEITSVSFSRDGTRVVSGSAVDICVWDVHLATEILHIDTHQSDNAKIMALDFSPDGAQIVSLTLTFGFHIDHKIRMWNATSGKEIFVLHFPQPLDVSYPLMSQSITFSPDGTNILGSVGSSLRMWNASSGEEASPPLTEHSDTITAVAFSRDGQCIASASLDNTIRIQNRAHGAHICSRFRAHKAPVSSVAFSPSGKRLVSLAFPELCSWDPASGVCLSTVRMNPYPHYLCRVGDPISITREDGYIVHFATRRRISRLPSSIYTPETGNMHLLAVAAHEDAIAVSTSSDQFVILRFPSTVLSSADTRPCFQTTDNGGGDWLPIEIFYRWAERGNSHQFSTSTSAAEILE